MLPVALDVARAMLHLHSEGLLHGDLKASNVLLDKGPAFDMAGAASSMQQPQQPQQQPRAGTRNVLLDKGPAFELSGPSSSMQQPQQQPRAGTRNVLLVEGPTVQDVPGTGSSSIEVLRGEGKQQEEEGMEPRGQLRNVPNRLIGKVSDFGLSLMLDVEATHVSHMHGVSGWGVRGVQGCETLKLLCRWLTNVGTYC